MTTDEPTHEQLLDRIAKLEAEIADLKGISLFSDIQPVIEQKPDKFRLVQIATIDLEYRVRWQKPDILKELWQRVAQDLKQNEEGIQLLHPTRGTVLRGDEKIEEFIDENKVIHFDFQYVKKAHDCGHHHHYSDNDDDDDDDDDFSDDDWDNGCSCSHH